MDLFNLDHLIRIRLFDESRIHYVKYREYRKGTLWNCFTEVKEGYYNTLVLYSDDYLGEDLDGHHDIFAKEDKTVWLYPRIKYYFADNTIVTEHFDKYNSAYTKVQDIKRIADCEFIEVE